MQDYQGGATIKVKQTAYYCTLCKFRGASREELAQHRQAEYVAKTGSVHLYSTLQYRCKGQQNRRSKKRTYFSKK